MCWAHAAEDEDVEDLDYLNRKKRRSIWKCPGGTNSECWPVYCDSVWGKILQKVDLQIKGPLTQNMYTRQFRVLHCIFVCLVKWVKEWHEHSKVDASCYDRRPTELIVLDRMHMVGRAACFYDVHELSFISHSTMHHFCLRKSGIRFIQIM